MKHLVHFKLKGANPQQLFEAAKEVKRTFEGNQDYIILVTSEKIEIDVYPRSWLFNLRRACLRFWFVINKKRK